MGRRLEEVILNELAAKYSSKKRLVGEFIPTAKNVPVKDLYDRLGFGMVSDNNGHKTYELNITDYKKKTFDSYKTIQFEA